MTDVRALGDLVVLWACQGQMLGYYISKFLSKMLLLSFYWIRRSAPDSKIERW